MPNNPPPPQSFIPHESPIMTAPRRSAKGLADVMVLLSFVVFIASVALAVGVFLYEQYLSTSTNSKLEQLERAQAAFEPSLIRELTRLDDRMRAAGEILGKHIAPTAFFRMLELSTIENVSFTSLSFDVAENGQILIEMEGVAESVNSIALQADLFSKGGMITSPIFSSIDRQLDGVHFDLEAFVNPTAVNFSQVAASAAAAAVPVQPSPSPAFFGQ